jgi:hypothetical protein
MEAQGFQTVLQEPMAARPRRCQTPSQVQMERRAQETEAEGRNWKPMKCLIHQRSPSVPLAPVAQDCQCRQQRYHTGPTVVALQPLLILLEVERAEP